MVWYTRNISMNLPPRHFSALSYDGTIENNVFESYDFLM
jgi:hypothetical protein